MPVVSTTELLLTVKVPQIRFIAGVRGHSCCATETGTQLSAVAVMAAMKVFFFRPFSAIFRAPPGCPGVERQFSEVLHQQLAFPEIAVELDGARVLVPCSRLGAMTSDAFSQESDVFGCASVLWYANHTSPSVSLLAASASMLIAASPLFVTSLLGSKPFFCSSLLDLWWEHTFNSTQALHKEADGFLPFEERRALQQAIAFCWLMSVLNVCTVSPNPLRLSWKGTVLLLLKSAPGICEHMSLATHSPLPWDL